MYIRTQLHVSLRNAVGALRSSESSCITAFCWAGVTFAVGLIMIINDSNNDNHDYNNNHDDNTTNTTHNHSNTQPALQQSSSAVCYNIAIATCHARSDCAKSTLHYATPHDWYVQCAPQHVTRDTLHSTGDIT